MSDKTTEELHRELQAACNELPGKPEVRRVSEKMSAEEAAEEFADGEDCIGCDYCGDSFSRNAVARAFLAGIEYERKRSGDECRKVLQNDPYEARYPSLVVQVGERHWRIKDPVEQAYPGYETFETKYSDAIERYNWKTGERERKHERK